MKTLFASIALIMSVLIISQSCAFHSVKGNGQITSNEIILNDYKEMSIHGSKVVVYEQKADATPYIIIETDENIMPLLDIRSENGVLVIKNEKNISPSSFKIYTNSTALEKVSSSGSSKIHLSGDINTPSLTVSVSGSGKVNGDNIICQDFRGTVSGSGNLKVNGSATNVRISTSGSGKVDVSEMPATTAECRISGSGTNIVNVSESLNASVSGSGKVNYIGSPEVNSSVSGSGKVRPIS